MNRLMLLFFRLRFSWRAARKVWTLWGQYGVRQGDRFDVFYTTNFTIEL